MASANSEGPGESAQTRSNLNCLHARIMDVVEASTQIEQFNVEITNMCVSNKFVFLMGDFNVRIHNKQDFMDEDEFLCRQLIMIKNINQINLPKVRTSQDKIINNEGNMLLDIPYMKYMQIKQLIDVELTNMLVP